MYTILIAEDNADDYFLLEHAFKRAGFTADKKRVRDGIEARAYLAGEGKYSNRATSPLPTLIISDLKMPRMNGLELLRWARRQPFIKRIPFILLSGSGSSRDVTSAYDNFANSYHVKPSRLEDLVTLLKELRTYWFKTSIRPDAASRPMTTIEKS